ncbi:MAG: hypothetical protein HFG75_08285 [Hungatella sp.]|nr:hypothetical protein [Hungatella sp.]
MNTLTEPERYVLAISLVFLYTILIEKKAEIVRRQRIGGSGSKKGKADGKKAVSVKYKTTDSDKKAGAAE